MEVGVTIGTELDLATLDVRDGLGNVHGDGAGLGVRHQAAGTEDAAQTTDLAHHVRGGDHGVEVQVSALDLRDEVVVTDLVGARSTGGLGLLTGGEDEDPCRLASAVGKVDGTANHLVGLLGVDAETDGHVDGLVELCRRTGCDYGQTLLRGVELVEVHLLSGCAICLTALHVWFLSPGVVRAARAPPQELSVGCELQASTSTPMERAVPATIFMAASTSLALRSGILVSAISRA